VKLQKGLCYTVFSAPNYCGRNNNKGAILQFANPDTTEPAIVQFDGHHYTPKEKKSHKPSKRKRNEDKELQLALKLSTEQDIDHEVLRVLELSKQEMQQVVYYVDDDECALDVCATDEPEVHVMQPQSSSSFVVMV